MLQQEVVEQIIVCNLQKPESLRNKSGNTLKSKDMDALPSPFSDYGFLGLYFRSVHAVDIQQPLCMVMFSLEKTLYCTMTIFTFYIDVLFLVIFLKLYCQCRTSLIDLLHLFGYFLLF